MGDEQLVVWIPAEDPADARPDVKRAPKAQLAHANPKMLEWGRSHSGLSLEQAAKKIGVRPFTLTSWESGAVKPTIPQLRRVAAAYKRPMAAFYLPAVPRHFTVVKDHRRLPGEAAMPYSPALLLAFRAATYRRDIVLSLDPDAEHSPLVGGHSITERPEDLAAQVREVLGVSLDEQRSWDDHYAALNGWKNALEALGVLVFHFIDVNVHEVRGFSLSEPVLPVIGLNGGDSVNGRIFTLIHETGHLLLGDGGSCDLGDYTEVSNPLVPVEVFCNAFAGALLVPRSALLEEATVRGATTATEWSQSDLDRLARRFRISREVVLRRLLAIGRTDEHFYGAWREAALTLPTRDKGSTGRPSVAVMTVRDVGKPFARLVLDAYHADSITGSDVSEYLGVRLKHLPRIEKRLGGPDLLTGGDR